jgi:putative ABC transport system substrate-binding protein
VRRREFIALVGGASAWPLTARAQQQQERVRRIGVLMNLAEDDPEASARISTFVQRLSQLGWTEGRNLQIDRRWAAGKSERFDKYAGELVALAPDVVLASGYQSVAALRQATRTLPVVFANVMDPVGSGFVSSLARPGGNITGFSLAEFGSIGKLVELLREIAPRVTRAGVLRDPFNPSSLGQFAAMQSVAPLVGIELTPVDVQDRQEIEHAFEAFARGQTAVGLIVPPSPMAARHRDLIITLAAAPITCRVWASVLRRCRRFDLLREWHGHSVSACRGVRGPHPQGRAASEPSGAGVNQIRIGHQSQDRKSARLNRAAIAADARRRGDRITILFVALHESGFGPKRTLPPC